MGWRDIALTDGLEGQVVKVVMVGIMVGILVGMVVGMAGEVLASWKCVCMLRDITGEVVPGEGI